jgi:hypothetical protein
MDQLPEPPRGHSSNIRRDRDWVPPELEEVSALLARLDNPFEWTSDDPDQLEALARAAMLAWDGEENTRIAELLPILYAEFQYTFPEEDRRRYLDETWRLVAREEAHADTLWQIAFLEEDPAIVAAAIKAYVCVRAYAEGGPTQVVDELLGAFEEVREITRAGIFHGLMVFGDEFVLDELWPKRWELTDDEVAMVCNITTYVPRLETMLFLLAWMEEAQEHSDHSRFRSIEWALTPSPDVENESEVEGQEWAVTTEPDLLVAGDGFEIDPHDFARQIEPRLRALANPKSGPRASTAWIEGWGLEAGEGS